jgi:hypothetical protein
MYVLPMLVPLCRIDICGCPVEVAVNVPEIVYVPVVGAVNRQWLN